MTERLKTEGETPRDVARAVNRILDGGINSVGTVTLDTATTTTLVADFRCHINSKVLLMPTSANAAAEAPWITTAKQQFTITHDSATSTDRTFGYVILG